MVMPHHSFQGRLHCQSGIIWSRSVYHLYVVRVADRAQLQKRLDEVGVSTGIHYPVALHLTKAYEGLGFQVGDFPVAEKSAAQVLSLPMYPELNAVQQEEVVAAVAALQKDALQTA